MRPICGLILFQLDAGFGSHLSGLIRWCKVCIGFGLCALSSPQVSKIMNKFMHNFLNKISTSVNLIDVHRSIQALFGIQHQYLTKLQSIAWKYQWNVSILITSSLLSLSYIISIIIINKMI